MRVEATLIGWLCAGALAVLAGCHSEPVREDRPPAPPSAVPVTIAPPSATPEVQGSAAVTAVTSSAEPPRAPRPDDGRFAFAFDDLDLPELVKLISSITGKRFVYTSALPKLHASAHSPERLTAEEAYQEFLSILTMNGLTVVVRGRLHEIRPSPGVPVGR